MGFDGCGCFSQQHSPQVGEYLDKMGGKAGRGCPIDYPMIIGQG